MSGSGRLQDRRAVVTGGAAGIGRGIVERFLQEGARVTAVDRDRALLDATVAELGSDRVRPAYADVTDPEQMAAAIDAAVEAWGGLDVLVNNAGAAMVGGIVDMSLEDYDRQMAVNVRSVFIGSKLAWPHLLASRGNIVNTASVCGLWGYPGLAAYCASKGAVIMLTKALAIEGASDGLRVNCVCPGDTETPNIERYYNSMADPAAARAKAEQVHPLGRLGRPRDIADAFLYLASAEADWVTGSSVVVDGGRTSGVWLPDGPF